MKRIQILGVLTLMASWPLLSGQGCQPSTPGPSDGSDLTATEKAAIRAAAYAFGGLSQAITTAQNAVQTDEPTVQAVPTVTGVGDCPTVTSNGSLLTGALDVTIDFGDGCTVGTAAGEPYTCAGSASGSLNLTTQQLSVAFEQVNCGEGQLDGSADLGLLAAVGSLMLSGSWDLTWVDEHATWTTDGTGTGGYVQATASTTVPTFDGLISDQTSTWSTAVTDLLISFNTYGNYIPYGGTVEMTGADIRDLVIRFSQISPTTGLIEVSVGGGPFFVVQLSGVNELL